MIEAGKRYYYKGNEYVVVGFTKMKSTLDGSWIDAVQYKKATEQISGEIYTRSQTDFEYNFIPAVLETDMLIVAISMGKIVGEYKVIEVGDDNATAVSSSEVELIISKNVNSNSTVNKISGGVDYTADYAVFMTDMKQRIANQSIITNMTSFLSNSVTRIANIDNGSDTYALQEAMNSIEQTMKIIYDKFGI